jgi:phage anti-repressor protein
VFLNEKVKNPARGRPKREVIIALDAAKEIGMAARGDYGKRLRRYFLDCEFRLPARLFIEDAMARGAGGGAPGGSADRET